MSYPVSTQFDAPQPPFARLCQSAMLVGRAIANRQASSSSPSVVGHLASVSALADELERFATVLGTDDGAPLGSSSSLPRLLAPRCLTWSAIFVLLDPYCCPVVVSPEFGHGPVAESKTPEEMALQRRATNTVVAVVDQVHISTRSILEATGGSGPGAGDAKQLGRFCPLALDAVYCSVALFWWLCQEAGDEMERARQADVEACLERVGERWGLAREYLQLKAYHDDNGQCNTDG